MPDKIISIYCFFDELLKSVNYRDDKQAQLSTAEIMTVALSRGRKILVAAEFFVGNQQAALDFLTSHKYIKPFSKSRFNRRLHRIPEALWRKRACTRNSLFLFWGRFTNKPTPKTCSS